MNKPNIDLNALEAAARAATPGEWQFWNGHMIRAIFGDSAAPIAEMRAPYRHGVSIVKGEREQWENGAFIAASSPAVVLELIRRLRAAIAREKESSVLLDSARSVLDNLARLHVSPLDKDGFRGWENGLGEQVGDALQDSIEGLKLVVGPCGGHAAQQEADEAGGA